MCFNLTSAKREYELAREQAHKLLDRISEGLVKVDLKLKEMETYNYDKVKLSGGFECEKQGHGESYAYENEVDNRCGVQA